MIKNIRNSKGYVSIEAIVMSSMILAVGVVAFMAFQSRTNNTVNKSFDTIEKAEQNGIVNNPWK